jgi:hypothetical protein
MEDDLFGPGKELDGYDEEEGDEVLEENANENNSSK